MSSPIVFFSDIDELAASACPRDFSRAAVALSAMPDLTAVILCSGRTRAEIERLQTDLDCHHPFLCEHGAALFVPTRYFAFDVPNARELPGYQVLEFGRTYCDVVGTLHMAARRAGVAIRGFSDMSVEEVSRECGLSLLDARLAKLRDYVELFRILDRQSEARERLKRALRWQHLQLVEGHPYSRVGSAFDLSLGVGAVSSMFKRACGSVVTVGPVDESALPSTVAEWATRLIDLATNLRARQLSSHSVNEGRTL